MQEFKNFKLKRKLWFPFAILVLVVSVLIIEFSIDLSREIVWHHVVVGLDAILVAGFVGFMVHGAILNKNNLLKWLFANRVNLMVLVLTVVVLPIPRIAGAIVICRLLINVLFSVLDTSIGRRLADHVHLRPSQTLALSFIGLIAFGTILLLFPAATVDGKGTSFLDSLFMITSAACVVGLSIVDVGTYFTFYGQAVILVVIQVGGLGIMVLSAAFAVLIGTHLQTRQQAGLWEMYDVSTSKGLKSLIQTVAAGTFLAEFIGATILFFSWDVKFLSLGEKVWWSIFHAISAFCNAGLSLSATSLTPWVGNVWVCSTIIILITLGGLGFFVIADLVNAETWKIKSPSIIWARLNMQTRVVLLATVVLDLAGMLLFLFFEYDGVLAELGIMEKIGAALFQSVSSRTAGFNVVQITSMAPATLLFLLVWMFIGASPGSTGGGIKTTTLAVALMSVRAMLTGRDEVELMGRRMPSVIVNRSLSIILISGVVVIFFLMWMVGTQNLPFERLLFEVVSAFGTVGLSIDITTKLDNFGRILVILLMFVGRIGPMTMALAIGERSRPKGYRLAEGRLAVG